MTHDARPFFVFPFSAAGSRELDMLQFPAHYELSLSESTPKSNPEAKKEEASSVQSPTSERPNIHWNNGENPKLSNYPGWKRKSQIVHIM